ncbi:MAG: hypothetical protein Q4B43_04430 [Bacteroidota bacterium]|nr:hypothetical protein [Bacteroidota bacterium]
MFRFTLFATFLFTLIGCSQNVDTDNKLSFRVVDTLYFDTNYIPHPRCSGSYYDKTLKKRLIYLSNPVTEKKMDIFDDQAQKLYTINLEEGVASLNKDTYNINVISKDTIIMYGFYNNKISIINAEGKVWRNIDLSSKLEKDNFRIRPSENYGGTSVGNSVVLNLEFNNYDKTDTILNLEKHFKNLYSNIFESYKYGYIPNIFSDSVEVRYFAEGFYKNFYEKPYVFVEPNYYRVLNDKLFSFSVYSDQLLVYDLDKLKLEKKQQLKSDYTKIGIDPPTIEHPIEDILQEEINIRARCVGYTQDIIFDSRHQKYYITQHLENLSDAPRKSFSIIFLDTDYNQVGEFLLDKEQMIRSWTPILTDRGIMLCSKKNTIDENAKKIFYILDL